MQVQATSSYPLWFSNPACTAQSCQLNDLQDTDSVVDSLETGLGLLIHFIWLIFYLLVWGVNIVKVRALCVAISVQGGKTSDL